MRFVPFFALMNAFANTFLLVYAALFPIINPVGGAPLFLGLTQFASEPQRAALARRVARNCFFLLLGSLLVGSHVLEFFGISLAVVRIAGGLVVSAFGWRLLNSETPIDGEQEERGNATIPDSFYPLTMPLTVGPGSMSVAMTLGSQRPKFAGIAELLLLGGAAIAGLAAMALTIYICYRSAESTVRLLGKTGTSVVVRLSAFILLCIGIQILWGGLGDLLGLKQP
jgi:multiple antibiotic resistance protein